MNERSVAQRSGIRTMGLLVHESIFISEGRNGKKAFRVMH